jgi:hypothetical protein
MNRSARLGPNGSSTGERADKVDAYQAAANQIANAPMTLISTRRGLA